MAIKPFWKKCQECKEYFLVKDKRRRYCTRNCRDQALVGITRPYKPKLEPPNRFPPEMTWAERMMAVDASS